MIDTTRYLGYLVYRVHGFAEYLLRREWKMENANIQPTDQILLSLPMCRWFAERCCNKVQLGVS